MARRSTTTSRPVESSNRLCPTLSIRPKPDTYTKLKQLTAVMGKTEGQLLADSLVAIIEMIEGEEQFVPLMVQRARILRTHLRPPGGTLVASQG